MGEARGVRREERRGLARYRQMIRRDPPALSLEMGWSLDDRCWACGGPLEPGCVDLDCREGPLALVSRRLAELESEVI